jgi:hypothetical protein
MPNLILILLTAFLTALFSGLIHYYLDKQKEWELKGLGERLKAYRLLYSFCTEILDRDDELESESEELFKQVASFVHEKKVPWDEWNDLPLPGSYKEVKRYDLTKWFRLRPEKYTATSPCGEAYRPLTFFAFTIFRHGANVRIPIHEEYEQRIKSKGFHLFFSKNVENTIDLIIDCDKHSENYPDWTLEDFLVEVDVLTIRIKNEIPSLKEQRETFRKSLAIYRSKIHERIRLGACSLP